MLTPASHDSRNQRARKRDAFPSKTAVIHTDVLLVEYGICKAEDKGTVYLEGWKQVDEHDGGSS